MNYKIINFQYIIGMGGYCVLYFTSSIKNIQHANVWDRD